MLSDHYAIFAGSFISQWIIIIIVVVVVVITCTSFSLKGISDPINLHPRLPPNTSGDGACCTPSGASAFEEEVANLLLPIHR